MPIFHCLDCTKGSVKPWSKYDHFVTRPIFMVRNVTTLPYPKLEGHPLLAVRGCLLNVFVATRHIGGRSSICNLRPCHDDRDWLVMDINELSNCQLLVYARLSQKFPCVHDLWKMDLRILVGLIHHLLHFHQFPFAKAPISVGSSYVLQVSPGIDSSLRIIWNYPGAIKGLHGSLSVRKNIDDPTCVAVFYILHYASLVGIYFSLEYRGVEPKSEALPASGVPHPSKSTFIGLGPACVLDQAPFLSGLSLFCH